MTSDEGSANQELVGAREDAQPGYTVQERSAAIPHEQPMEGTGTLEAAIEAEPNRVKRFFKILGPGLITGASDDDPSGIGTYAVAGASLGFSILWTALVTFPMAAAIQVICAKIGLVSGKGIAGVLRDHYPRWLLYPAVIALLGACTINAGADIGAIAAGINLLAPGVPIVWLIVPISLVILGLQVFGSYRLIAQIFKWLTLSLFAYILSAFFSRPNPLEVLHGTFVPTFSLDSTFLTALVAVLGTTISPYLFFWQSNQEVEEEISMGKTRLWQRRGASDAELKYAAMDVNIGIGLSELVMYFIIFATAATLFKAGQTNIQSASDAAQALRPLAGDAAYVLLAVGLIGAGFLAVPILTGAGAYALAEALGWRYGLDRNPGRAKEFYAVIVLSTLVGMLINFVGINPIDALVWTAVINGFLAPPLMVVIMLVSNNRAIMGDRINNRWTNALGWLATLAMFAAAVGLVVTWGQS
ncbi:MAG: Nramp family divalent metal transporter [Chloroflexi bacterium]|nr:Nramp family divalent metal transporter [Chloroflexota bacterium]